MINLVQRIEAERERRGISVRRIERITGIDRCTIDNGLSGETQEMKFDNFISIVNSTSIYTCNSLYSSNAYTPTFSLSF
ncbi:hypothetical protein ACT4UM_17545, partial [Bacillus sp. SS-TM]